VISKFDECVRPVAPVDAACAGLCLLDVKALGSLDGLEAEHLRCHNRPRDARTTLVRNPGLEERNGDGVASDDGRGRGGVSDKRNYHEQSQ
jgi:hypothetical protein